MDAKLAEYRVLMSHIESQFRLIIQVFTASLVVGLGLLGYAFQIGRSAPHAFLCPILIFMPCGYLLVTSREEIFRWGMYIRVLLEDSKDLRYETALARFREKYPLTESLTPIFLAYWLLLVISVALFVLYSMWAVPQYLWYWLGWGLAILAVLATLCYLHVRYAQIPDKKTEECTNKWEKTEKEFQI